jgi:hypothetical protein
MQKKPNLCRDRNMSLQFSLLLSSFIQRVYSGHPSGHPGHPSGHPWLSQSKPIQTALGLFTRTAMTFSTVHANFYSLLLPAKS